jgi:hypothetical protein
VEFCIHHDKVTGLFSFVLLITVQARLYDPKVLPSHPPPNPNGTRLRPETAASGRRWSLRAVRRLHRRYAPSHPIYIKPPSPPPPPLDLITFVELELRLDIIPDDNVLRDFGADAAIMADLMKKRRPT